MTRHSLLGSVVALTTVMLVCIGAQPVSAQGGLAVLHIRSQTRTPQGWVLTLASGAVITVPIEDLDLEAVGPLKTAMVSQPPAGAEWALPSYDDAISIVRAKCAKASTNDLMRSLCETQQRAGMMALRARAVDAPEFLTMRATCAKSWPDDFKMRDFCEVQQLESMKAMSR